MTTDATDATNAIERLALNSGGYAMVALDQRESMRTMLVARGRPAGDEDLREFKRTASAVLAPYASAILMDAEFSTGADLDVGDTPLILAADRFEQLPGGPVLDSWVSPQVTPERAGSFGAAALKQLVLWHADQPPAARQGVLEQFLALCRSAGLPGIVEGVVRPPADAGRTWNRDDAIVAAAAEVGRYSPHLYKAELPAFGRGDPAYLRRRCQDITEALAGLPWVVLSSGVQTEDFPEAVRIACTAGASGFLAGRAIWADCVGGHPQELRERAVARLRNLVTIVQETTR